MAGIRTLGRLAAINAGNMLLALVNTAVVAHHFGTGRSVEIYLAAVGLYSSVMKLAQTGQVSETLVPTYHMVKQRRGTEIAFQTYTALMNRMLLALGLLCSGCWLLATNLAAWRVPGFEPAEISTVTAMFRWVLPLVVLQFAAELLRTLANAESLFGGPELLTAAARVTTLVTLVLLAGRIGPWAMVTALWCSVVAEISGSLLLLRRRNYKYSKRLKLPDGLGDVRLLRKLASTLPYVAVTQFYLFVLDAGLSRLAQGSFAVFHYAQSIWDRSQGVFLRPISATFFTEYSQSHAGDGQQGQALTDQALARVLAISALVTAAVLSGAAPALHSLLPGARFPGEQVHHLVWLLGYFYVLMPVMGTAVIFRKVMVSLGRMPAVYLGLAAVQVLSTGFAWQIVPVAGLPGVLLVTSINLVGFCLVPWLLLRYTCCSVKVRFPYGRAWRWLIAASSGVLCAWLIQRGAAAVAPGLEGRTNQLLLGVALAAIGFSVTFGVSLVLAVPESQSLAAAARRVIFR